MEAPLRLHLPGPSHHALRAAPPKFTSREPQAARALAPPPPCCPRTPTPGLPSLCALALRPPHLTPPPRRTARPPRVTNWMEDRGMMTSAQVGLGVSASSRATSFCVAAVPTSSSILCRMGTPFFVEWILLLPARRSLSSFYHRNPAAAVTPVKMRVEQLMPGPLPTRLAAAATPALLHPSPSLPPSAHALHSCSAPSLTLAPSAHTQYSCSAPSLPLPNPTTCSTPALPTPSPSRPPPTCSTPGRYPPRRGARGCRLKRR